MSDIAIIYEDDDLLAVDKPSGISVHGDGKSKQETIADWILEHRPKLASVGEQMKDATGIEIARPGIVHRLDKDTSGVLLIAKNQDAYLFLKKQFQERKVKKKYQAIVYGVPKEREGVIDKPLGRSSKNFRLRAVVAPDTLGARAATTRYKVLKTFGDYAYLEVYPETGRMHQVRAHLKWLGNPVLCDPLYAPNRVCPQKLGRLALHAKEIQITLPLGTRIGISSKEPKEFEDFLASTI